MKVMGFLLFLLVFICVLLLIDIYAFQAVVTALKDSNAIVKRVVYGFYWLLTINMLTIMATFYMGVYYEIPGIVQMNMQGLMILTIVSKLLIVPFLLVDDMWRLTQFLVNYFSSEGEVAIEGISRAEFLSKLGILVGALPLIGGAYGMISSAYRYIV